MRRSPLLDPRFPHRSPLLLPRFPHRSPLLLPHRSNATPRRKLGLIRNHQTDLAANFAKRRWRIPIQDGPKKKAGPGGLATLRPAPAGRQYGPALHMPRRRYAEEGSRELNRWDVALEIFKVEEAYRLRRLVDKVAQPAVDERRETMGLSGSVVHDHDDDNGGDEDVLGRAALPLPAASSAVALPGHGDGGAPFVMGVSSDRNPVAQQVLQPCSTVSMHPDAGMDGYHYQQQHMAPAMDMYGYGYGRMASINQQLACDVCQCQQSTARHEYGFQRVCNIGFQPTTDGNFAGAPPAQPALAMSYAHDLMNAGTSRQTNGPGSQQHYLRYYREDMHRHVQDNNSGGNNWKQFSPFSP